VFVTGSGRLSTRFEDALVYAIRLHADQFRKGGNVPYATHLLAVAAIVLDHGGDEDQAIAALLHDAVEDQGGRPRLEEIRAKFGDRVARIVDGCTDSYGQPRTTWRQRKDYYIEKIASEEIDVWRVSAADKLHNSRSTLRELRERGEEAWGMYAGGKEGSIWYYRTLADFFKANLDDALAHELDRVVCQIEKIARDE
jgi:(p)ppGpp synthase/HD superfamily hydrolase